MLVERSIDADRTVGVLERLAAERGAPKHIRMDNGPELTGHALRTGACSRIPRRRTSSPARRGRTRSWNRSTRGARRAAGHRGVLLPGRGEGRDLRLAAGLQLAAAALRARDALPRPVPRPRSRSPQPPHSRNEPRLGRGRGPSRRCELPGHPAQRRRTDRPDGRLRPRRSRPGQLPPRQPVPWTNQPNPKLSTQRWTEERGPIRLAKAKDAITGS